MQLLLSSLVIYWVYIFRILTNMISCPVCLIVQIPDTDNIGNLSVVQISQASFAGFAVTGTVVVSSGGNLPAIIPKPLTAFTLACVNICMGCSCPTHGIAGLKMCGRASSVNLDDFYPLLIPLEV